MVQLKEQYQQKIAPAMREARKYGNAMQVPRLQKIVVNIGVNTAVDKDTFKILCEELAAITGQRPAVTRARLSISNFKLREGMPIGAKVTLRGARMYEFLERLINVVLPRIRDFRGVSPAGFDGRGNYTLGLSDQSIFPELDPDKIKKTQGMDISVVTTAETDDEGRELLRGFGMPFASPKSE